MNRFVAFLTMLVAAFLIVAFGPAHKANAQTIKYEVKVKGYSSSGWIEIRDGKNVGGKIIRDGSGTWTDRVARDEPLRVTITGGRKCKVKDAIVGVVADNGFVRGLIVDLPFTREFVVSKNPAFDNVTVVVINTENSKVVTRRVPIGTR